MAIIVGDGDIKLGGRGRVGAHGWELVFHLRHVFAASPTPHPLALQSQEVGGYDTTPWLVDVKVFAGDGTSLDAAPLVFARSTIIDGTAVFEGLALRYPKVGLYTLFVTAAEAFEASNGMLNETLITGTQVEVFVTEGQPAALYIRSQPSEVTDNTRPLRNQPVLELHDAAGNPILQPTLPDLMVRARLSPAVNISFDAGVIRARRAAQTCAKSVHIVTRSCESCSAPPPGRRPPLVMCSTIPRDSIGSQSHPCAKAGAAEWQPTAVGEPLQWLEIN